MIKELPYVSIVIPTYKDWYRLERCIKAIELQTYPIEKFELIIINNDANETFPNDLQLPMLVKTKLLTEILPGSYNARNTGLKEAEGDIIAFTDSDCEPMPDWIESAVDLFSIDDSTPRIAGAIEIFRDVGSSWLTWKFDSISAFNQSFNVRQGVSVTANLFVKKQLFDLVGSFNSELRSGGDIEWNQRATLLGYTLSYSGNTVVKHPSRKSWRELVNKSRRIMGGEFEKAREKQRLLKLFFWHLVPPIRYFKVLFADKCGLINAFFATSIFSILKLCMLCEFLRLLLGGRPLR